MYARKAQVQDKRLRVEHYCAVIVPWCKNSLKWLNLIFKNCIDPSYHQMLKSVMLDD